MTKYLIGLRKQDIQRRSHGEEDSSLQKAPRWEELEERWVPYFVMALCDGNHFIWINIWKTICILLHEFNYLDLDTICFIS